MCHFRKIVAGPVSQEDAVGRVFLRFPQLGAQLSLAPLPDHVSSPNSQGNTNKQPARVDDSGPQLAALLHEVHGEGVLQGDAQVLVVKLGRHGPENSPEFSGP